MLAGNQYNRLMRVIITTIVLTACQPAEPEGNTRNFAQPRGADVCEDILSSYCDRCEGSDVYTVQECLDRDEIDVDCDDTINVGTEHENCLEDIQEGECGDALPPSCYGVVIVDQ